jgi:hypothetical protein
MSTRRVFGAILCGVVAFGCAEPNQFNPADLARADAQGGSGGRGGMGGAGGVGGGGGSPGTTGGAGGTSVDAPVAGSGGDIDADPGSEAGTTCNAGVTRCEGKVVEVCTVAGTWVMKETCSAVCTAGACAGMCTPGSKHCGIDQTPETCSDLGEWVPDAMPCPNVCSGMGQCTGMCKPGSKRCSGPNELTTQTCDENGAWVNGMVCPNVCSSGSCGGDCVPDTKRCGANNVQETCSAMGTWEPATTCPFVCMAAACAGECKPGAKRCSALIPQECDQNGRWQSMTACPNLCMSGACTGDCMPGQKRCSGNTAQTCSAAGRYVASETCSFVCQGNGVCGGQCVPGRRQCSGTTPQVCSTDGQWMNTTGNECLKDRGAMCGNANECASGSCVQSHCCNSVEKYCDGQCRANNYCCNGASCPITNGSGSCANGQCGITDCNGGFYECEGRCIGSTEPCGNTCQSGLRRCGTQCVRGNCCGPADCSNGFACNNNMCSTNQCAQSGQIVCGGRCITCNNTANGTSGCVNGQCRVTGCSGGFFECENRCVQNGERCGNNCGQGYKVCGSGCIRSGQCCTNGNLGCPADTCNGTTAVTYNCNNSGICQASSEDCSEHNRCASRVQYTGTCSRGQCGTATKQCDYDCEGIVCGKPGGFGAPCQANTECQSNNCQNPPGICCGPGQTYRDGACFSP